MQKPKFTVNKMATIMGVLSLSFTACNAQKVKTTAVSKTVTTTENVTL